MDNFKFGTCEFCFPIWGSFAVETAKRAGFDALQITDGGGYLQPHPKNNGFVEYERFGLDLRRKDSFPLTSPWVQDDYLEAAATCGIELSGNYLYLLDYQSFMKFSKNTPQGEQCRETIKNAALAAAAMKIPSITVPMNGMFGVGQHAYALENMRYAAALGEEYGVQILMSTDTTLKRQLEVLDALGGKVKVDFCTIDPLFYATGNNAEMLRMLGKEHLGQVRLKDKLANDENYTIKEEGRAALLGKGDARIAACMKAVLETGYQGCIVSETPYYSTDITVNGEDFISLAKKDLATMKRLSTEE